LTKTLIRRRKEDKETVWRCSPAGKVVRGGRIQRLSDLMETTDGGSGYAAALRRWRDDRHRRRVEDDESGWIMEKVGQQRC
jgi:hypothetical protein